MEATFVREGALGPMRIPAPESSRQLTVLELTTTPVHDFERFARTGRHLHWQLASTVKIRIRYRDYPKTRGALTPLETLFPGAKHITLLQESLGGPTPPQPTSRASQP